MPEAEQPLAQQALTVTSVSAGVFETYGGGILTRLELSGRNSQLLAFTSSTAFELRDQFLLAMTHFGKYGYVRDPRRRVLPLPAADFEGPIEFEVGDWFLYMGTDGARWRLSSRTGSNIVILISPAQMDCLLLEVECAIDHMVFIDTRPFNGMRWIQLSEILEVTCPRISVPA